MRALVILQSHIVGELIGGCLRLRGFEVERSSDSSLTLQEITRNTHDLLIMDDRAAPIDCVTLCKVNAALKRGDNHIVLLTENEEKDFIVECVKAGATKIQLVRLFSFDALSEYLDQIVSGAPAQQARAPEGVPEAEAALAIEPELPGDTSDIDHREILERSRAQMPECEEDAFLVSGVDMEALDSIDDGKLLQMDMFMASEEEKLRMCPVPSMKSERYVDVQRFESVFGAMEGVAHKVTTLAKQEDTTIHALTSLISTDPFLSASILRYANKRKTTSTKKISSVSEACVTLGLTNIERIAMSSAVLKMFKDPTCETPIPFIKRTIARSAFIARLAEQIAVGLGLRKAATSRVSQASLMSEVGRILMYESQPAHYADMLEYSEMSGVPCRKLEELLVGHSCHYYSRRLSQRWGVEQLTSAIIDNKGQGLGSLKAEDARLSQMLFCYALARSVADSTGVLCLPSDPITDYSHLYAQVGLPGEVVLALYEGVEGVLREVWGCLFDEAGLPEPSAAGLLPPRVRLSFVGPDVRGCVYRFFTAFWNMHSQGQAEALYCLIYLGVEGSPLNMATLPGKIGRGLRSCKGAIVVVDPRYRSEQKLDALRRLIPNLYVMEGAVSWKSMALAVEYLQATAQDQVRPMSAVGAVL